MAVLPTLRTIEKGAFSEDAKKGARAAIVDILHRHRVAGCKPPNIKVSISAGEYSLEEAAALALKPFGIVTAAEPPVAGRRFAFSLETSNAWTALHAICRHGNVFWRGGHGEKGNHVLFHEIPKPVVEKMFAIVGPYRVGGKIMEDWDGTPLILYLSAAPAFAVSRASVSKLAFKDVNGQPVVVDKVDLDAQGGGRHRGTFGYVDLAVVRGKTEELRRIHSVEGVLRVAVPEDIREDEFDLSSSPKDVELPLRVENGNVKILEPHQMGDVNLYFTLNGTKKTFLTWLEDERHDLLTDVHAWTSGTSGNIIVSQLDGVPRWLVVARIEKESETTYPFDCRRQKP